MSKTYCLLQAPFQLVNPSGSFMRSKCCSLANTFCVITYTDEKFNKEIGKEIRLQSNTKTC